MTDLMEKEYLQKFNSFLRNTDLSSTYKPVFLKSIMDLGDYDETNFQRLVGYNWITLDGKELKVELDFIAVRYAKYYWDMFHKFRLRQSHTPMDVNIHKIFGQQDVKNPPMLEQIASEKFSKVRKDVINRSIRPQVLKYLNKDLKFYTIVPRENYILFDRYISTFLNKYRGILIPAINYVITRYLEKINFSPRIAEKVLGKVPRDYLTQKQRTILMQFHDSCFYCGSKVPKYEIDHVIPFDYIFHTDVFNTVPACETCNLKKSNLLPTPNIFDKVIERNEKLPTPRDYSPEWYQHLYEKCVVEYHGKRECFSPK